MSDVVVPGQALELDPDGRRRLVRVVEDLIGPAIAAHEETANLCRLDWDWYDAKPHIAERSRPFKKASNLVYPLIATHADSLQARRFLSLFANGDIWVSKTLNEEWRETAQEYVGFLNHEADDNAFDLSTPANEALLSGTVVGSGIMTLQWGRRIRHRFAPGSKVPRAVQLQNGIHVFSIPREQILWQPGRTLRDSEFVIRFSHNMSLSDLVRAATSVADGGGGWNREQVAALIQQLPGSTASRTAPDDLFSLHLDDTPFRPVHITEIWAEWPMMRGMKIPGPKEDDFAARPAIVIYYHRDTNRVLHVMAHPYPIQNWPFYEFGYGRTSTNRRRGVAKVLEHLQASISTSFNQAHDSVTWANRILGITNDRDLVGKIFGDGLIYTPMDIKNTAFNVKQQPFIQPNLQLIQLALAAAERLTGMSDPNFGRESRSGGHPAPATSTLALLQQGQTVLARTLSFDRQELARFGEDCLALYQKFEAAENGNRIERIIGAGDARKIQRVTFTDEPLSGLIEMDVRAVSESQNAQANFQQAVQVDQVITNYYAKIVQGLNVAIQAATAPPPFQAPILAVAFHSMMGLTESVERILSAANVDDLEVFTEMLKNAINEPIAGALEQARLAASTGLQAASGPAQQPAVATSPNGVPAGAPGAFAQ